MPKAIDYLFECGHTLGTTDDDVEKCPWCGASIAKTREEC